jgi:hypothetical protein
MKPPLKAFLRGVEVDPMANLGPGLSHGRATEPISAQRWNGFAFKLGARLLVRYATQANATNHVIDISKTALATMATIHERLAEPELALQLAMIEATLRPMTMFAESPAAELELRIFLWGVRRARRDRHLEDSLAALARDAAEVHARLAAEAGEDGDRAREAEREAQRADFASL